jgi:hypothetical protein
MTRRTKDGLRWGFKTDAEAITREIRAELGLTMVDRLDPFRLAEHLAVPVASLSSFADQPKLVRHFRGKAQRRFSAVTVFLTATERVILYNDFHQPGRQSADITHECAHALLLHPPRVAFSSGGCRDVDDDCEREAACLGGTLLVPYEAALLVVRSNLTLEEAAEKYGVSKPLMRWRIHGSGAKTVMDRARAKWNRN